MEILPNDGLERMGELSTTGDPEAHSIWNSRALIRTLRVARKIANAYINANPADSDTIRNATSQILTLPIQVYPAWKLFPPT